MSQELEFIITADNSNVDKKLKETREKARDTKKALEKDVLIKLELDVANFQSRLDEARARLRKAKKEGDKEAIIKAQLDVNELSR
jgi:hypothetical protein